MSRDCFWLTKDQFAVLKPLLPNDTRSKPRVISGIIQVLKSGGRWIDAPEVYGPRKTLASSLGSEGRMGRHIPRTRNGRWTSCAGPDR